MHCFDLLPIAALIDGDVFSVHGGLSPRLRLLERINLVDRKVEIPTEGLLADLTWSDPEELPPDKKWMKSKRGAGFLFGKEATKEFVHLNRLAVVTRSHQIAREGYQWYFGDPGSTYPGRVLDVWSAPNYAYKEGNLASFLKLRCDGGEPFDLERPYGAVCQRIPEKDIVPDPRYFA
jgi:diadenosine tetraphosphatase ApaH/serine/threonine PP2A family protein phosphatase